MQHLIIHAYMVNMVICHLLSFDITYKHWLPKKQYFKSCSHTLDSKNVKQKILTISVEKERNVIVNVNKNILRLRLMGVCTLIFYILLFCKKNKNNVGDHLKKKKS